MRAVLDSSVLLSAHRHWLWFLAQQGYYEAVWSTFIAGETVRIRVEQAMRHGVARVVYRHRINEMVHLFSDVFRVADYRSTMSGIAMKDPDDVPILATAVAAHVSAIVTLNTYDFPTGSAEMGIRFQTPTTFLTELSSRYPDALLPDQVSTIGRLIP